MRWGLKLSEMAKHSNLFSVDKHTALVILNGMCVKHLTVQILLMYSSTCAKPQTFVAPLRPHIMQNITTLKSALPKKLFLG